jgi:hypothetical protein
MNILVLVSMLIIAYDEPFNSSKDIILRYQPIGKLYYEGALEVNDSKAKIKYKVSSRIILDEGGNNILLCKNETAYKPDYNSCLKLFFNINKQFTTCDEDTIDVKGSKTKQHDKTECRYSPVPVIFPDIKVTAGSTWEGLMNYKVGVEKNCDAAIFLLRNIQSSIAIIEGQSKNGCAKFKGSFDFLLGYWMNYEISCFHLNDRLSRLTLNQVNEK